MERTYGDGSYTFEPISEPLPGRPSVESVHSARLQKKRSVARARTDANRLTATKPARPETQGRTTQEVHKRKSSLRDTVKKIFTRRSKVTDLNVPSEIERPNSDRYTQHSSLQAAAAPLKYPSAHSSQPSPVPPRISPDVSDRAASAPLRRDASVTAVTSSSAELPRIRSPNAVEFPKSKHLKPLVLPTPFDDPRSTLRRRKTLPSILVAPDAARDIAAAITAAKHNETEAEAVPTAQPATNLVVSTSRKAKRRSRSAGDLREQALQAGPQRKRSDEIRFWRESIQTAILRNSTYVADQDAAILLVEDVRTPPRNSMMEQQQQQRASGLRASPPFDIRSSMYGTELSRDLEDRVAHLEANLHFFQRSLDRLQAGQKRRIDHFEAAKRGHVRRDSANQRTPSMLAEDLSIPLAPSQYRYAFEPSERPQTAPSRPVRPPRPDENVPPVPSIRQVVEEPKSRSPSFAGRTGEVTATTTSAAAATTKPRRPSRPDELPTVLLPPASQDDMSFQSLYRMLDDERSARRRLETQINDMRNEISTLQHQVSSQSQVQSQRSSYMLPAQSDVTAGSSRLRELLAEAEALSRRSMSPPLISVPNHMVSRFSASTRQESEAEHTQGSSEELYQEHEAERRSKDRGMKLYLVDPSNQEPASIAGSEQTGYDEYKTPTETRGGFPLSPTFKQEGGMF